MQRLVSKLFLCMAIFLPAAQALADDGLRGEVQGFGLGALGVALGVGLSVLGATLGQSRAAAAAFEGIARNPAAAGPLFVPFILGLALMESLGLAGWVMMYFLLNKI